MKTRKIIEMVEFVDWPEIGKKLGVNAGEARRLYDAAKAEINEEERTLYWTETEKTADRLTQEGGEFYGLSVKLACFLLRNRILTKSQAIEAIADKRFKGRWKRRQQICQWLGMDDPLSPVKKEDTDHCCPHCSKTIEFAGRVITSLRDSAQKLESLLASKGK